MSKQDKSRASVPSAHAAPGRPSSDLDAVVDHLISGEGESLAFQSEAGARPLVRSEERRVWEQCI